MDIPVPRETTAKQRAGIVIGSGAVLLIIILTLTLVLIPRSSVSIAETDLQLNAVKYQAFSEYITVRSVIVPSRTVILDLEEGGRVIALHGEEGDTVKKGDLIADLSNTNLRLSVTAREAEVSEQVNSLRNTRLDMERESFVIVTDLQNIKYNILRLEKLIDRRRILVKQNLMREEEVDLLVYELDHYRQLLTLTLARQKTDREFRRSQIVLLESTVERLRSQMNLARASLEQLHVKAPMSGVLSSLDVEVGQRLGSGDRLGIIDTEQEYDLSAYISEYYLNRIVKGQLGIAQLQISGEDSAVVVDRVYPKVKDAQFEVRFTFSDSVNQSALRRGQTVNVKLFLSESVETLIIPRSALIEKDGKNWVFVLETESNIAVRHEIVIGKRNADEIEVVSGINADQQVVSADILALHDSKQIEIEWRD